ncbi:hypothetical protein CA983_23230 [Streptomyces swartbergensis]|uniref:Uncharacterized protein n=1 Tax=Streptomyces swartbergensis TaxID=487165 RepID=A0A243S082_9ACTN|nr:hypothetical protein CA983_23230 [Streptomyces swartbergensis]
MTGFEKRTQLANHEAPFISVKNQLSAREETVKSRSRRTQIFECWTSELSKLQPCVHFSERIISRLIQGHQPIPPFLIFRVILDVAIDGVNCRRQVGQLISLELR